MINNAMAYLLTGLLGALFAVSALGAQEAQTVRLTPQPLPEYLLRVGVGTFDAYIFPASNQYPGNLPVPVEQMHGRHTGMFYTNPQTLFVAYKSAPEVQGFDRVIVNTTGDNNLENEKVLEFSAEKNAHPVTLKLGEREVPFEVRVDGFSVKLVYPALPGGKVDLGGMSADVLLLNTAPGMPYKPGSTLFLLDLDGDGRLTFSRDMSLTEAFMLKNRLFLRGGFYDIAVSEDGGELTLAAYRGVSGPLSLKVPGGSARPPARYFFHLLPEGGSGADIMVVFAKTLPISVPAGRYSLIDAVVLDADENALLTFAYPDFDLGAGGYAFDVGGARMILDVRQQGGEIRIRQNTLSATGDTVYNQVAPLDLQGPGPEVEISLLGNPQAFSHKGNMEYG